MMGYNLKLLIVVSLLVYFYLKLKETLLNSLNNSSFESYIQTYKIIPK